MRFSYKCGALSLIKEIKRLRSTAKDVGSISVFYGLYEIETDGRRLFAVSASDSSVFRLSTFENESTVHEFYELISENRVDTASFDGVLDDYMYSLNNIL